jgi:hypothetical protein
MGRFAGKTIAELREAAREAASVGEPTIIKDLVAEMETRIERRKQQGKPTKKEQQEFLDELRAGKVAPPKRVPIRIAEPESPDDELKRLRRELELWRSIYSHKTELLARWGMTDSLPIEMVEKVLGFWEDKIKDGRADLIRTKERLTSDRATIKIRADHKS